MATKGYMVYIHYITFLKRMLPFSNFRFRLCIYMKFLNILSKHVPKYAPPPKKKGGGGGRS